MAGAPDELRKLLHGGGFRAGAPRNGGALAESSDDRCTAIDLESGLDRIVEERKAERSRIAAGRLSIEL